VADNKPNREDAAQELGTGTPAATIDGALGPNWQKWQEHVVAHVQLPDADEDGEVEPETPVVPLMVYGDGPHDYIATDIDAGQVMVRDGNDATGKAWKWPLDTFLRFVAHAQGRKVEGEPEGPKGDNPYVAAAKQQDRTNRIVAAERDAAKAAEQRGETRTGK
jgi:hypothetical protein